VPTASGAAAVSSGPHELADCSDAPLRACLAPLVKPLLGASDMRALASSRCFKNGGAEVLRQAGDCLPLRAGVDAMRGKELRFSYFCSDVCPDYGGVSLRYFDVSASECCKLDGEPERDAAWGGYKGCSPAEVALEGGFLFKNPDGEWRRIISSSCPGRAPIIVDEWPCAPPPEVRARFGVTGPAPLNARYAPNARRYPDTDCPKPFNPALTERALQDLDGDAIACLTSPQSGVARIRMRFAPSGGAGSAWLSYPNSLNNTQGRCMEKVFEKARVLPFKGEVGEIWHELWLDGTS
jgi:hypothetical protein